MRKYSLKRCGMTILALFLLSTANISTAYAATVPDLSKEGSITVAMRDSETGNAVPGGTMTLLQAGNVHEEDGNFSFVLTEGFSGSNQPLSNIETAAVAENLAAYAKKQNIKGTTITIGEDGIASFSAVKPGLYLLIQEQAASGYYAVTPFLVSVPLLENGSYLYDIDATPKMERLDMKLNPPGPEPSMGPAPPPQPSPNNPPKTGDMTQPGLWLTMLCGSAAGIVFLLLFRKRPKKTER